MLSELKNAYFDALNLYRTVSQYLRAFSFAVVFGACWASGAYWIAIVAMMVVAWGEIAKFYLAKHAPSQDATSVKPVAASSAVILVQSIAFFGPAAYLVSLKDLPLFLTGVIEILWGLCLLAFGFVRTPNLVWAISVPGLGAALFMVAYGFSHDFFVMSAEYWMFPIAATFVFVAGLTTSMQDVRSTYSELERVRADAISRLRQLEYFSRHDELTSLLNRKAFDEDLENALAARSGEGMVVVIMIDLNGFKPINDSYGHDAGDVVLATLAGRLRKRLPVAASAYRLGGDEFAAILPNSDKDQAMAFGLQVIEDIRREIPYGAKILRLSASLGIAESGSDDITPTELCANADQAMYQAKAGYLPKPVVYDPKEFAPRLTLEDAERLEHAIRTEEIRPFYQPKYRLSDGKLAGFEALARWQHPEQGLMFPGDFLPDIEQLGLFGQLTQSLLRQVMRDVLDWKSKGSHPGRVAVNLPEAVLATPSGREELDWILAEFSDARTCLIFEITEDVFIARSGEIIQESISHFRNMGVRISLDDFGTGYASFQHLQRLEFDELKIDTSFVAGLGRDPVAEVIVNGFVSIANGLGVEIVAEGVEREDQLKHLRALGCQFAQGFYYAQALPGEEALALMQDGARRTA